MLTTEMETIWDEMVELGIATNEEIRLVMYINGTSMETLMSILNVRTGYSDWMQFVECECED